MRCCANGSLHLFYNQVSSIFYLFYIFYFNLGFLFHERVLWLKNKYKTISWDWAGAVGMVNSMAELRFQTQFKIYKTGDKEIGPEVHIVTIITGDCDWRAGNLLSFNPGLDLVMEEMGCPKVSGARGRTESGLGP